MRRWFRHFRTDKDLKEELQSHLDQLAEDDPAGKVRLRLGDPQVVIETVRDQELATMLESWYRDFVLGLRALRRNPVFCLTAIITLAIGIGANTAVFTVLYGLLLRSLPAAHAGELAYLAMYDQTRGDRGGGIPYPFLRQIRRQQHSFTDLSAWSDSGLTMPDAEGSLRLYDAALVSGNAFQVIGMRPYLGRLIASSDDVRGGPPEGWPMVLSYGLWKDRFAGDPRAIGARVRVQDTPVTIVGVAPPDFHGLRPGVETKLYLPFYFANVVAKQDVLDAPGRFWGCSGVGRLKPGASPETATAEIETYRDQLFHDLIPSALRSQVRPEKYRFAVRSARTGLPSAFGQAYRAPLLLMQGLVAIVLLLCAVNVGGLMMTQVHARRHEFAVRTAIGAARWRLVRQHLTESFVIALAGAALGSLLAWHGTTLLQHFMRDPMDYQGLAISPDRAVFAVTGILAVLTTLLFGVVPAWRAGRSDPGMLLKTRGASSGRRRIAGRAFIPIQVGLSVVLVAVAALLGQTLVRLRAEHTGFEARHVTIQTPLFNRLPQRGEAKLDLYQRMVDRLEQQPGMRAAAVTWYTPITGHQAMATFQPLADEPRNSKVAYNQVGPGYFRAIQTAILAGREFQRNERQRDVCVLNQSAASVLFPRQQALGRYVRTNDPETFRAPATCRVVGIAEDARFASLREPPPPTLYFPLTADLVDGNMVFLMNSGTKAQAIAGYRVALKEIAPSIPLVLFATLDEQINAALGTENTLALMSAIFGGLALFLSALGLYGLLASSVTQRTGEIGVRIALGAQRGAVLRMIVGDAFRLLLVGMVLGGLALALTVRYIQKLLYGVSTFDPVSLTATALLLGLVALAAAAVPALRAAAVDPAETLRAE